MAKLLLIDDSELVLDMLAMALSEHELMRAEDVNAAADFVSRETLDLIVTDLNLPNLGGKDPVTALRELGAEAPVVLMSGMDPAALQRKADELGAHDSLSKEIGLPAMGAKLVKILDAL